MEVYQTKARKLTGTNYAEVYKKAFSFYKDIRHKTRRRPYIRSAYFNKEKVFLELFWNHLHEKLNHRDKLRRVRYFPCALELIQHSRCRPTSKPNPNRLSDTLYRFVGKTKEGEIFFVQLKEEKGRKQKWLVSVFSDNK